MKKVPNTVNGRFYGMFYELSSGRSLYLAHRTPGQIYQAKMAWCLDESTLRTCRSHGIEAVGVAVRHNGRTLYYLTHIDDFYGDKSFRHYGDSVQRGLPAKHFRVNPTTCSRTLARITALGR